MMDGWT